MNHLVTAATVLAQQGGDGAGIGPILWIAAAVLVIAGIVSMARGSFLGGILLIVIGLLVGPGGVSIFS